MAYTTIDNPELYFQVKLYTGNNTGQSITFDGSEDMQPDMIWNKSRSNTEAHNMWDSVRGAEKYLTVNDTTTESDSGSTGVSSFNSDGFTVGSLDSLNDGSVTYVAWCWKESATSGFDIVTYTGDGSDDRTVSHSLSASVNFVIVKRRNQTSNWLVQGDEVGSGFGQYMELNATNAVQTASDNIKSVSSSVLTLGTNGSCNEDSDTYVAYCFAEKQGFSKFGGYTGNGNADGTFIYTGFKPAWVLFKRTDATAKWYLVDNKREPFNDAASNLLYPDSNHADEPDYGQADFLSNGIKIRSTDGGFNASGGTYVYMAFAEAPFVNSEGVPCNAR